MRRDKQIRNNRILIDFRSLMNDRKSEMKQIYRVLSMRYGISITHVQNIVKRAQKGQVKPS